MIVASFHTQPCNHLPPPLASHFPGLIAEGGVAANRPPLAGRGLYPACSRKSSCRCTVGRASGKRVASVLLRCCHGIASLLLPCTSLVHPLYIPCTSVVHAWGLQQPSGFSTEPQPLKWTAGLA